MLRERLKKFIVAQSVWKLTLLSILSATLISNAVVCVFSVWRWQVIIPELIGLSTFVSILTPLLIMPPILRTFRKLTRLEERTRLQTEQIELLKSQQKNELAAQKQADEIALLHRLGVAIASGRNLYEALAALHDEINRTLKADVFYVGIYDWETDVIHYPISFNDNQPFLITKRKLKETPGFSGEVILGGKTVYLKDITLEDQRTKYVPIANTYREDLHSFLGVPLVVSGKVFGVLSVQSKEVDAYSAEQIRLLESFTAQAAIGIERAALFDQFQKESNERNRVEKGLFEQEALLQAVTFTAEKLINAVDWRAHIDSILERFGATLHATHVYLFERHILPNGQMGSSMRYEWTAAGYPPELFRFQNVPPVASGFGEYYNLMQMNEAFTGNAFTFREAEKKHFSALGIKSVLEVPVFVHNGWWGTLGLDDFVQARVWGNAEIDAVKIAGGILGASIQRQEIDSAVRESERKYRRAIEAAGAVPYYHEYGVERLQFMGMGIETITGYSAEEMDLARWNSIVKEARMLGDLEAYSEKDATQLVWQGQVKTWQCDYRIVARDGQSRWVSDSAVELFNENGRPYASIGIMQDITERREVEANLRHREAVLSVIAFSAEEFLQNQNWRDAIASVLEQLGRVFNLSHAYLFENHLTPQGVFVNSLRYEWTAPGQTPDLDNPVYQNVPLDDSTPENYLHAREYFIGHSSQIIEISERDRANGIQALLETRIMVDGQYWGALGFDEKNHAREWQTLEVEVLQIAANILGAAIKRQKDKETLQQELDQRTALIAELEMKNRELNDFTYTVSHDLKSPLVTINGFLGYLKQDIQSKEPERIESDLQRIQNAVLKMQQLLNELLELSRVGRMINAPETAPFEKLAREALELTHGQLAAKKITVHIQPNLPAIHGDKPRLIEALQNLIDNAAKYMGNQPNPQIEIGAKTEETGEMIFFVRDNGLGIEPQYHERIFGLFNKLDAKSEGTGIGLALVKKIVEIHGGRIWVESEPGQGSTFYFTVK
ncbi:MAG: GAF domain-containing protein [Anaerolineales bacterium]|nr:GAF domain-containing protein [Anaerolineales bacterium]